MKHNYTQWHAYLDFTTLSRIIEWRKWSEPRWKLKKYLSLGGTGIDPYKYFVRWVMGSHVEGFYSRFRENEIIVVGILRLTHYCPLNEIISRYNVILWVFHILIGLRTGPVFQTQVWSRGCVSVLTVQGDTPGTVRPGTRRQYTLEPNKWSNWKQR